MGTVDIAAGVVVLVLGTIVVVSAAYRTLRAKLKQRELSIVRIMAALEQCKPVDPSWDVLARELFTLYDQDQSGRLSADELTGLAERMFENLSRRTIAVFLREEALRPGQQHVVRRVDTSVTTVTTVTSVTTSTTGTTVATAASGTTAATAATAATVSLVTQDGSL